MIQDTALLRADGISKIYAQGALSVGLHRFSASFYKGEFVAITGSSGSGKSTLLNILSGLDSYDEGELYFMGEPTSHFTEEDRAAYRMDHVAFIFQDYNILDSYTVFQNIELALLYSVPDPKERKERVDDLIQAVGLAGHEKQRCSKLSGGQKQRVSIARALAKDAPILFADEPCGNLDSAMTDEIMALLHDLSKDKLVIIVTHSYDEVAAYATRKIRLADGELVEDQVFAEVSLPIEEVKPHQITRGQKAKALMHVGMDNLKATPKRSAFGIVGLAILTAIFIVGMVLTFDIMDVPYFTDQYYRYDLQVVKVTMATPEADASSTKISDEEVAALRQIEGVVGVYRDNTALNGAISLSLDNLQTSTLRYARPATNLEGALYQGRLPQSDDEIVLAMPANRKDLAKLSVGMTIGLSDGYYYGYGSDEIGKFTLVGITLANEECAYFTDQFFTRTDVLTPESPTTVIVSVSESANMDKVRDKLSAMGYIAFHRYGDHPLQAMSSLVNLLTAIGLFVGMLLLFRIITGSYRALERSKRKDYNIMRTVGLPNPFVKSIYYVEMGLQGVFGWLGGLAFALIAGVVYGVSVTPSIAYGFQFIAKNAGNLAWIIVVALIADMVVTISNAVRFNRYFYRQTVKMSLKEAAHHD